MINYEILIAFVMSSKYLKTEESVRKSLSEKMGVPLLKRTFELLPGVFREFDAISADNKLVAEIKASNVPVKGELRHTQLAEMCEACLFMLTLKGAERRILALSDVDFFNAFLKTSQAAAARALGIEVIYVP